jgi:hypothetical protein
VHLRYHGGFQREEAPYGTQTDDAPILDRFSSPLAGGLLVFDLGFVSFLWFDDFTGAQKFFVTRMREKTAYRTVQVLRGNPYYRDELLHVGQYRSNPSTHPLRMVSVLWQGRWYRYLTNVLGPQVLSARQVCELYRRRWRIEDACALTERLLDLASVWTGSTHAVQWQLSAMLVFYGVLVTICQQIAQALGAPPQREIPQALGQRRQHRRHSDLAAQLIGDVAAAPKTRKVGRQRLSGRHTSSISGAADGLGAFAGNVASPASPRSPHNFER